MKQLENRKSGIEDKVGELDKLDEDKENMNRTHKTFSSVHIFQRS
jgi:hypothetical protein